MLVIENYSKSYQKNIKVVKNLNLNIKEGEIFAFIGHNGAGKTTTIKSIVGALNYDTGSISLNGVNIKEDPILYKSQIAYIPDNPNIYENITGYQFLNFIINIYNIIDEDVLNEINELALKFEILDELNDEINTYSHGMKQKLLLISAFIRKPKLLILDEPFTGLDPKATYKMKELMKELSKNGTIIFFSTHILEVAEKFCDTVGIIRKGELIKLGTMKEVKGDKSLENVFMELSSNE